MNSPLPSVSEAIVAIHSRFIVEKVWCQNPARLFQRFVEAVDTARAASPARDHAYFDARIARRKGSGSISAVAPGRWVRVVTIRLP